VGLLQCRDLQHLAVKRPNVPGLRASAKNSAARRVRIVAAGAPRGFTERELGKNENLR
jgi:hypothetical protein